MKLVLLTLVQSALTVGGMGLIGLAVGGKPLTVSSLVSAVASWQGAGGVALLIGSFVMTTVILSFARLSVFIPLNTAMVFVLTVLFAVGVHGERPNAMMLFGLAMIVVGISVVASQR